MAIKFYLLNGLYFDKSNFTYLNTLIKFVNGSLFNGVVPVESYNATAGGPSDIETASSIAAYIDAWTWLAWHESNNANLTGTQLYLDEVLRTYDSALWNLYDYNKQFLVEWTNITSGVLSNIAYTSENSRIVLALNNLLQLIQSPYIQNNMPEYILSNDQPLYYDISLLAGRILEDTFVEIHGLYNIGYAGYNNPISIGFDEKRMHPFIATAEINIDLYNVMPLTVNITRPVSTPIETSFWMNVSGGLHVVNSNTTKIPVLFSYQNFWLDLYDNLSDFAIENVSDNNSFDTIFVDNGTINGFTVYNVSLKAIMYTDNIRIFHNVQLRFTVEERSLTFIKMDVEASSLMTVVSQHELTYTFGSADAFGIVFTVLDLYTQQPIPGAEIFYFYDDVYGNTTTSFNGVFSININNSYLEQDLSVGLFITVPDGGYIDMYIEKIIKVKENYLTLYTDPATLSMVAGTNTFTFTVHLEDAYGKILHGKMNVSLNGKKVVEDQSVSIPVTLTRLMWLQGEQNITIQVSNSRFGNETFYKTLIIQPRTFFQDVGFYSEMALSSPITQVAASFIALGGLLKNPIMYRLHKLRKCKYCGSLFPVKYNFCRYCGNDNGQFVPPGSEKITNDGSQGSLDEFSKES